MIEVLKKTGKLRGRSLKEIRVRAAQMLAARAEKYSRSSLLPDTKTLSKLIDARATGHATIDAESLWAHFRARREPAFFAFAERDKTVELLRQRFGGRDAQALIERARRISGGRFDLLGHTDLLFGSPPDFHLEPLTGKRAPLVHWSSIGELDAEPAGDKKIIWELNRQQYFQTLGRAYRQTGDESFARVFAEHLEAWMDQNPPKVGINWASSLEVAFRAVSWLWALHFFRDSTALSPPLFLRALKYLYVHARHLETYLSTYSSPNTHLTGEALGLFYLGTLLPEFRRAARWRKTGERILMSELERHVRPDGVYFEQSSYYQRYTADFYTHFYILSRANDTAPIVEVKLKALLDHLMYITRPDGTTPFFGDDDGGRLSALDERAANDFRATLSTGAALFGRADYKYVAESAAEETLWLLGPKGLEAFDAIRARPPAQGSRAFKDGGYYLMRDGWTKHSNYMLIDCGPHGTLNCGHAHADALSFEMAARGRTLLVDPGTYTYTGSAELRDYFRSTAAHNTLTIDGQSSSVPGGPFSWKHVAQASAREWLSSTRFDYFEGAHDGFMRLAQPAGHTRAVLFLKGDYWIVRDRVETAGAHLYELRFHFAADTEPELADGRVREAKARAQGVELFAFADGDGGSWHMEEGCVSRRYGERVSAPVCRFESAGEGAQDFYTLILPRGAGERAEAHARELEAARGRAFELSCGDWRDLLVICDGARVTVADIASDFAWSWLRFAGDSTLPRELVLLGGRSLEVNGRKIVEAPERVGYMALRWANDELEIETDAGGEFTVARCGADRVRIDDERYAAGAGPLLRFVAGRRLSAAAAEARGFETVS
jgi:Heparinase II/III-like protein/Heparinase II/III N-terminus